MTLRCKGIAVAALEAEGFSIIGYTDRLSVAAGDSLGLMVSSDSSYEVAVVRLDGDGSECVVGGGTGSFEGFLQTTSCGSYVCVAHTDELSCPAALPVSIWIQP